MTCLKTNIRVQPSNCAQCMSCMLICSFTHFKSFNPSQSYIQILPGHHEGQTWVPTSITFRAECRPNCWLCSQYCAYGALEYIGGSI
ncbi:MAG: hypothetical protein EU536_01665 [Promethearchaeota archaeon]|nr:MAG: hypothetical protein EU536_01665 [Candidatus Lokiarchaeota archaeon]